MMFKDFDKKTWIFIVVILLLGIFVRLYGYQDVGYWGDDMTTLPTGLLYFYPHTLFPGLLGQGEPILGNIIIASGCRLSGEDFSGVTEMQKAPMFYPGREILIGPALAKSDFYCHLPIYIGGIIALLIISLLAILLLEKYSAIYSIIFFSFFPVLLKFSTWIHVDIFSYVFVWTGLLFLWLFYKSEYTQKWKEILLFCLASLFFAFGFMTKLPNLIFIVFAFWIFCLKYKITIRKFFLESRGSLSDRFKSLEKQELKVILIISCLSVIIFLFVCWILLEFNFGNFFAILAKYKTTNAEVTSFGINKEFFSNLYGFILGFSIIDLIILIASLIGSYSFIKYFFKNQKKKNEIFILSLFVFSIFSLLFFSAFKYQRVFFVLVPGIIFFITYNLFNEKSFIFKLFKERTKIIFLILMILSIVLGFCTSIMQAPYFYEQNSLLCKVSDKCDLDTNGYSAKITAETMLNLLQENETYYPHGISIYYIRNSDGLYHSYFEQAFIQQFNKKSGINDYITYYKPENRTLRYILVGQNDIESFNNEIKLFKETYEPNGYIQIKNKNITAIYDIYNLNKSKN